MPTSPESGGPTHVGRIVDPLAVEAPEELSETDLSPRHPVRERLLERARDASGRGAGSRSGQLEPQAPAQPRFKRRAQQLSPALRVTFGTLMGLAVIATLVALAMNLDKEQNLSLLRKIAPSPSAPTATNTAPALVPPGPTATSALPPAPGPWRIDDAKGDPALRIIRGTFKDQPFLSAIQAAGLDAKQAYRAMAALKDVRNLNRCGPNHEFIALIERGPGTLKAFEYLENKETVYQAKANENGYLVGVKLDLQIRREQKEGALLLTSSDFSGAAKQAGLDPSLRTVLADALQGHEGLADLAVPATIRVVAQEITVRGTFSRYAGIEAAEIKQANGETLRLYYFRGDNVKGYFDAKGRSFHEGGWRKPIAGAPITSPFNPKRMHPVLHKIMPHQGTDFGAKMGEPVYSASFGTVKSIGPGGPSGNLVVLEHTGGIETGYAHLSRFAEGLKVGDKVKRQQLVGYVGSTGRSTGPHLHFSVKKNGVFVDSATLHLDGLTTMPSAEQSAFEEIRRKYDALLDHIPLPALPPTAAAAPVASGVQAPTTSAAPAELDEGDLGSGVAGPTARPTIPTTPKNPASPTPTSSQAPLPAAKAAPSSGPNVIYLNDADLQKLQSATEDGQVDP